MEAIQIQPKATDLLSYVNLEMGRKFYIGYENEPERQVSILYPDWSWIKEHFGENFERLNDGRKNEIANLEFCLLHNVPIWEVNNLRENGKWMRESDRKGDYDMSTGKKRLVEYKPYQLSETSRKEFTENISKGLLILCELTATLKGQIALTY